METVLTEIIGRLRAGERLTERDVIRAVDLRNRERARASRDLAVKPAPLMKRALLPLYLNEKRARSALWESWGLDEELEGALFELLRVKPRRSASGVATITVLVKPWPCSGACLYCPQDIRMPKSYLADEPACRRAEGLWFDPFLQVANRLGHLRAMGHRTERVELIIAGGTWDDYPLGYRRWFVSELLRALALDDEEREAAFAERERRYEALGLARDREALASGVASLQRAIDEGRLDYNAAFARLYRGDERWRELEAKQSAPWETLARWQRAAGAGRCRASGIAIETRPELVDERAVAELARFGVTRVQLGVQSLEAPILATNARPQSYEALTRAFRLLRDGGFVIHGHYMLNLPGSTPARDAEGFRRLVEDPALRPDELKLYPCVLVKSAPLFRLREAAGWAPYPEDELIALMAELLAAAPPWLRISRMVRDISAHDIVAGLRRANARQLVEARVRASGREIAELRSREIGSAEAAGRAWFLREMSYETSSGEEWFLSWEDEEGRVGAYGRLTLGKRALLREVHELGADAAGASELGPAAHAIVTRAQELAAAAGHLELTNARTVLCEHNRPYGRL